MKILFIHGFGGNSKEFDGIISHLRQRGNFRPLFYNYKERFGTVSLRTLARRLSVIIEKEKPDALLCLSQGGIIGSLALESYVKTKSCRKCITICTPFRGTWMAYLSGRIGVRQLRPGSELLTYLEGKIRAGRAEYFSAWNPLDLMVIPGSSGNLSYARKSLMVISLLHPTTWNSVKAFKFIEECLAK